MTEDYKKGNPRTINDHNAWRVRGVQQRQAQDRAAALSDATIKMSMIVAVDKWGNVQLENYTNERGVGQWFACMNYIIAKPGQRAFYMLDQNQSPIVLGVMPNEYQTWHPPDPRYFSELEHFMTGTPADTSGNIGLHRWNFSGSGGGNFQHTLANASGAGWHRIHTGGTSGNNAILASRNATFLAEKVREIEIGFSHTHAASVAVFLGLTDNGATYANAICAKFDTNTSDTTWKLYVAIGASSQIFDTGVPVIVDDYMVARLRNLGYGAWELEMENIDTGDSGSALAEAVPTAGMYLLPGAIYDRANGAQRSFDIDYIRWTMFNILRGPGDYWDR